MQKTRSRLPEVFEGVFLLSKQLAALFQDLQFSCYQRASRTEPIDRVLPGVPNRTKETGTISVLLFIEVEMGTFLSLAEELWQHRSLKIVGI